MAKIIKGKDPEDKITESMFKNALKQGLIDKNGNPTAKAYAKKTTKKK